MSKKKNKNKSYAAPLAEVTKIDAREEKEGKYISHLGEKELTALQKRKTIFMLLSTLFFGLSLFIPVMGREKLFDVLWLTTLYVIFDVALILISVYVSYQGFKKHKIRSDIYGSDAPKRGFNKQTYFSYELFNAMHFVMAAIEIAVGCLAFEVWGILNFVAVIASAVFSFLSRQVLYRANANNLDFLPPRNKPAPDTAEFIEPPTLDANTQSNDSANENFFKTDDANVTENNADAKNNKGKSVKPGGSDAEKLSASEKSDSEGKQNFAESANTENKNLTSEDAEESAAEDFYED